MTGTERQDHDPELCAIEAAVAQVEDPELPQVTIADLGILRDVRRTPDGDVVVTITPTYSGCPALEVIQERIIEVIAATGSVPAEVRARARVENRLSPAWTTDWVTESGRAKLAAAGIGPPTPWAHPTATCPRCGGHDVEPLSEFGATACQALLRCSTCREPFTVLKVI